MLQREAKSTYAEERVLECVRVVVKGREILWNRRGKIVEYMLWSVSCVERSECELCGDV